MIRDIDHANKRRLTFRSLDRALGAPLNSERPSRCREVLYALARYPRYPVNLHVRDERFFPLRAAQRDLYPAAVPVFPRFR